ncbi:hypothetical protein DENSPDRAFT_84742 [Dentipellis sp. KUC8613]|nr:hypothetical protein DENSPDRAFT_84742 [Dentipellis sp. KUC8613]
MRCLLDLRCLRCHTASTARALTFFFTQSRHNARHTKEILLDFTSNVGRHEAQGVLPRSHDTMQVSGPQNSPGETTGAPNTASYGELPLGRHLHPSRPCSVPLCCRP